LQSILLPFARIFFEKMPTTKQTRRAAAAKEITKLTNQRRPVNYEPKKPGATRTENWKNVPFA
jgi:hypothetical protein